MALLPHWIDHIERWQSSGLSQTGYCRQHGLNTHTFAAWLSDYRRSRRVDTPPALIPVQLQPPLPDYLILHNAKGHRLELPTTVSAVWLAELWRCLD